jgi:hypothetical protein
MKNLSKLIFISLIFLCFSCSENIDFGKINTDFVIEAPYQTSDMKLVARSSTEDSLFLTANLKNADDNSIIDSFSTSCVPEQLISVQLQGQKWDKVFVEIIFSDIEHKDLTWAYGKSESVVLENRETDISVELEYYDLAFYLTQNPFELIVTNEAGNKITKKSASGNYIVNSTDVLNVSISNLDIFGEVDYPAPAQTYSISWTLNGVELDESTDSITLDIFKTEGILSQNNVLQAEIDITGVGKFNASFVFDVELN